MPGIPLILAFVAIALRDQGGDDLPVLGVRTGEALFMLVGMPILIALVTEFVVRKRSRDLARTGLVREHMRALRAAARAGKLAILVHLYGVLGVGTLDLVRSWTGDLILVDEAIVMLPPILVMFAAQASLYRIDRQIEEAQLIRRLDTGEAFMPIEGLWRHTVNRARDGVLSSVILLAMLAAGGELAERFAHWAIGEYAQSDLQAEGISLGIQLGFIATILVCVPAVLVRVWRTAPIPESPVREAIEATCARWGVRVRGLLLWRTSGRVANGALLGFVKPMRYILLTDALLEGLRLREIEAVAAHEVGHAVHRHTLWLGVTLFVWIGLAVAGLSEVLGGQGATVDVTVLGLVAGLLMFGAVSRRFERQADAFAAVDLARSTGSDRVTAESAGAMAAALAGVAGLNHSNPQKFAFRHGSIAQRQRALAGIVDVPIDALPIDRAVRAIKALTMLGALVLLGQLVVEVLAAGGPA